MGNPFLSSPSFPVRKPLPLCLCLRVYLDTLVTGVFHSNREEIEKQKAKERYMKMHLAGKTEQAKADLARLAIIRKQREEAARKKEEERKGQRVINHILLLLLAVAALPRGIISHITHGNPSSPGTAWCCLVASQLLSSKPGSAVSFL